MNDQQSAIRWAKDLFSRDNWAILDTETTGLGNTAQICQIAIIDPYGEVLLDSLVKPTVPIEPAAAAIHGISADKLQNAPIFFDLLLPICQAIGKRDLVIYNAEYDLRLIRQSASVYNIHLAFPTSDRRGCRLWIGGGCCYCAMLKYSEFIGEWNPHHGNYRWQKLPGGDHSALGDCFATLEVIKTMADSPLDDDEVLA